MSRAELLAKLNEARKAYLEATSSEAYQTARPADKWLEPIGAYADDDPELHRAFALRLNDAH